MRLAASLVFLVACGGADPLDDEKDVAGWANASSAIGAYEPARQLVAFADGEPGFADPACPITSDDTMTATFTGSCVDRDGNTWSGTATVQHGTSSRVVTFDGFGNDSALGALISGRVTIDEQAADLHAFDVDLHAGGGLTTDTRYTGTVRGGYTGPTTWNGSGTITRDGDFFNGGTVSAETVDQVRDNDACPGEGFSGTTTINSETHVVVITYDGATDCDPDHSAEWSLDGENQGILAGVTCSAGGSGAGWIAIAVIGLLVRRRPRQRPVVSARPRVSA